MAIYDFSKADKAEAPFMREESFSKEDLGSQQQASFRSRFLSSLTTRLFIFLLLIADLLWVFYSLALLGISLLGKLLFVGKARSFQELGDHAWVSLRRSLVCGVSLFIALFNPSFGIMIACTYFLMYDKSGIEEVVPSSLQSQIKEFFPKT
jgi:hypothetical protein